MSNQIDNIIYVGRFQPFHNAHLQTILHALTLSKRVVVVVGSADQPRDEDNPFYQAERIAVIAQALRDNGVDMERVNFTSVENTIYNNALWGNNVATNVAPFLEGKVTRLIGHTKDESSFYLKMFPQWGKPIEMPLIEVLDATTIRQIYFSDKCNFNLLKGVLPGASLSFLEEFQKTDGYGYVMEEAEYIRNYRNSYAHHKYPPIFHTGDCVVFKDNHVLMIERANAPGKGLKALPGGFMNAYTDANSLECAIRELYEETKIKVPEKIIRKAIVGEKEFSAIKRSRRGRVITMAQFIVLDDPDVPGLPAVKGSDDAKKAEWIHLNDLRRLETFEDHYDLIQYGKGEYFRSI